MRAKNEYVAARNALMQYCEKATDYVCEVKEGAYPLKVVFKHNDAQAAMFDENRSYGVLEITVGLDTNVSSTLNFKMDSELLKKMIKNAEKIAFLYYHAFREQFDDLTACEIQILPQKDHDDKQTE